MYEKPYGLVIFIIYVFKISGGKSVVNSNHDFNYKMTIASP